MNAVPTLALKEKAKETPEKTRRCLATGEVLPKAELIRFVIGPDRAVVPDLAHNLPGRGLWVEANAAALHKATTQNLFAKAAKSPATPDPDLIAILAELLHKRCLAYLGLAKRAGAAVLGQTEVEVSLKAGKLVLIFLAPDASNDLQAFRASRHTTFCQRFTRQELGATLGYDQLAYVGLKAHSLTETLVTDLRQLEKITAPLHSQATDSENK